MDEGVPKSVDEIHGSDFSTSAKITNLIGDDLDTVLQFAAAGRPFCAVYATPNIPAGLNFRYWVKMSLSAMFTYILTIANDACPTFADGLQFIIRYR